MIAMKSDGNSNRLKNITETLNSEDNDVSLHSQHGNDNINDKDTSIIQREVDPKINESSETEFSERTCSTESNQLKDSKDAAKTQKALSYQDIHSEYTKKRYRNVESKVAQYIAHIRALDKKNRHTRKSLSHGTLIQQQLNENENRDENQTMSPPSDDTAFNSHETSFDGIICVEKHVYEDLLKMKENHEYLEAKLEEKHADNCRLKHNLDIIRIELSQCKDKLEQKSKYYNDHTSGSNLNSKNVLNKCATQSFLPHINKVHKETQTDITKTSSPVLNATPIPPPLSFSKQLKKIQHYDANAVTTPFTPGIPNESEKLNILGVEAPIKMNKTTSTVQPLALNFSPLDTEYDRYHNESHLQESANGTILKFLRSNTLGKSKQIRRSLHNNNYYNDNNNNSSAQSPLGLNNQVQSDLIVVESSFSPIQVPNQTTTTPIRPLTRNRSKRIQSGIKKFFHLCTKCRKTDNTNDCNNTAISHDTIENVTMNKSSDNMNNTTTIQQQSFTQVPLLRKSSDDHCRSKH